MRLVDLKGRETGPYPFSFYPEREILEWTKRGFGAPDAQWASFDPKLYGDQAVLYVMSLQLSRDALREVRYSIDSCALDQRLPLRSWNDLVHGPSVSEGELLRPPADVAFACFQLVYRDGEVTEPRRVERAKGDQGSHRTAKVSFFRRAFRRTGETSGGSRPAGIAVLPLSDGALETGRTALPPLRARRR